MIRYANWKIIRELKMHSTAYICKAENGTLDNARFKILVSFC